jgi:hypothetical protein
MEQGLLISSFFSQVLGMPLECQAWVTVFKRHCLNHPILASCGNAQALPHLVYGLVVAGVDGKSIHSRDAAQKGILGKVNDVGIPFLALMPLSREIQLGLKILV